MGILPDDKDGKITFFTRMITRTGKEWRDIGKKRQAELGWTQAHLTREVQAVDKSVTFEQLRTLLWREDKTPPDYPAQNVASALERALGISEHEHGFNAPQSVEFKGMPPMPLADPADIAHATVMAYKICQDENLACVIGVAAAEEKSIRNGGKLSEHLIRHLLIQHGVDPDSNMSLGSHS